jgi:kynureninase
VSSSKPAPRDPLLAFREEFPILEKTSYLVSNSLGPMPRTVPERLAEYARDWGELGVKAWTRGWWERPVHVGNEIAPLINAGADEVVMLPNVTIAQTADERTRLVAVSHVLFRSAYLMDADAICRRAHEMGALVSLDSFHAVGIVPVDVKRSDVDFLTGGVLKWLCGGPGACFLYVSPNVRDELKPALTGWQAHARPFAFEDTMEFTTGAFRWLNGTPVIPALYAAAEGPKILRRAGIAAIREKSVRLTSRLIELADDRGYTVNTPRKPAERGGTVTIDVPHGYEVTQHLLSRDILVDYRVGAGIRIAPHFFTREEELEAAVHEIDAALESGSWQKFSEKIAVVT